MRQLLTFALVLVFAGTAMAADLGTVQNLEKPNSHIFAAPSNGSRVGGDDMDTAVAIPGLPFDDTGNTCNFTHVWDEECPYTGSLAPDVWYSFTPAADMFVNVDLEGSFYDTKTFILDGDYNAIACNDDYYPDYTSLIEGAALMGGVEYFIVVDGWNSNCGDYVLSVYEFMPPEPCIIDCVGVAEGEPDNGPGYVDNFNSGCNADSGAPFSELVADEYGNLTFCGVSGWDGAGTRDTDWYTAIIGSGGSIEWTVNAEQESYFFLLAPQDCATVAVAEQLLVTPCEPQTLIINGTPGDLVWLWAGASTYDPPAGFVGYNYNYQMDFVGLQEGPIATEETTFDNIKSMYR